MFDPEDVAVDVVRVPKALRLCLVTFVLHLFTGPSPRGLSVNLVF
jgi:hypothetical protein